IGSDIDGSGGEWGGSDGRGSSLWRGSRGGEWASILGGEEGPRAGGIDGLWLNLVGADGGDPAKILSWSGEWAVVDGDKSALPVVPDDSRAVGRDGGLSASLVGWGTRVDGPGLTRVGRDGKLGSISAS